MTVHDNTYNVKQRQPDTLYEPVMFEAIRQIRVSCAMFKVTSYVDFEPYLKSLNVLKN